MGADGGGCSKVIKGLGKHAANAKQSLFFKANKISNVLKNPNNPYSNLINNFKVKINAKNVNAKKTKTEGSISIIKKMLFSVSS